MSSATLFQADHGREASHPRELSWPAWKDVLFRLKREADEDELGLVAAGVAFYALLALFPSLAALVSLWGLLASQQSLMEMAEVLQRILSPGAAEIITQRLEQLQSTSRNQLGWTAGIGLFISLWSARKGMNAMMVAHNIVYEEDESRGWFKRAGLSLLLTVGGVLVVALALASVVVAGIIPDLLGLPGFVERLIQIAVWLVAGAFFAAGLAGLYRYAPSRSHARWRWLTPGAAVATVLWLAASVGFSIYVENFGSYGETYGTLGGVVILLMWLWLSAFVILLGAELNAEMEHQTTVDTTRGRDHPPGLRGAHVADTAGVSAQTLNEDDSATEFDLQEELDPRDRKFGEG